MEDICRLCCSSKFVSNYIFDEENALYLKMSLYLPIKVFKNDHLPQKVCDKCSCKVNDFYQFCNETIEVQNRLHSLLSSTTETNESVDLTDVKDATLPVLTTRPARCEQATQTDEWGAMIKVKVEHRPPTPVPIKLEENSIESEHFYPNNIHSDSSDDISLIKLKKKKRKVKSEVNGEKKKKKRKHKHFEKLLSSLSDITINGMKCKDDNNSDIQVKQEMLEVSETDLGEMLNNALKKKVKKEPNTAEEFNCCICFTVYYSRSEMLHHYKEHADEDELMMVPPSAPPPPPGVTPLRCQRCNKVLEAATWAEHWARHWELDRRPYRCALCEKTFRDHHQILKHGMSHKPTENGDATEPLQKRFLCDVCPEAFVYLRHMLSHRLRAHPEAASRALQFRCAAPHCARAFSHLNSLQRHARAHSGERNHLCNVCGKALSSREHLKFHIRIHTGYKPNVCQTCGKGFVKKCNLTLHERVHSGEKPHVCTHCGKAFSQRSTLVIHERYHSGSRPYVCSLCGRGFVAKGLLSMHLKTTCI